MPVTINGTTGITTPDVDSTADGSFNGVRVGNGGGSGVGNAVLGVGAGSALTTGTKNTILGSFSGNQSGFDIRTANNWVVISDGDGTPVQVYNPNGIYYTDNGFREYKNAGFVSIVVGNTDILIATNWSANQNIYYETNMCWNNGDGGAFSIGVIWNSFDGATTRIRKIAENNATPIPTVTFFLSGSNLYLRYTANAGLNGYYQLYVRSQEATLNAF
jgi:hypothetical protein